MASLTRLPTSQLNPQPGATLRLATKAHLYSVYRGTYIPIELTTDAKDEAGAEEKKKIKELEGKIQAVWTKAQGYVPEGCTNLRVNLSERFIAYTDAEGEIHYADKEREDPAFRDLMNELRSLSKTVLRRVQFGESVHPEASFETSSQKWADRKSDSLDRYIENEHLGFGRLSDELKQCPLDGSAEALDRIIATEAFIQNFRGNIHQRIREIDKRNGRDNIRQSLRDLQRIADALSEANINREALYCAVGVWGNADPADSTVQVEKPKEISQVMERILEKDLEPGSDTRGVGKRFYDWISSSPEERAHQLGLGFYTHLFAQETGDLGVHDRLAYQARVEKHGERPWNRASLMEFLAHSAIHMKPVDFADVEKNEKYKKDLAAHLAEYEKWQAQEPAKLTGSPEISWNPPDSVNLAEYAKNLQTYLDDPEVPEVTVPAGLTLSDSRINYADPTINYMTVRRRIESLIALCTRTAWEKSEPRMPTKPKVEINPNRGSFDAKEALRSFGVSPSDAIFKDLLSDFESARLIAAQVLHAAGECKADTWQKRVKEMKKKKLI